jgi:glycosyltransferase involved in cell wall biosynthesis
MDLYITHDDMALQSGGGVVTRNESAALASMGPIVWLDRRHLHPDIVNLPENAFAFDTMAAAQLLDLHDRYTFGIAHFYSGTFPSTIAMLKARGTKISYTVAAHNPQISMEEHERFGFDGSWPHLKNKDLFRYYTECHRQADVVVCPSRRSADIMQGMGCKRVVVINHGIEKPDVPFVPYPKEFRVGYLGQAGADKGLGYLMAAIKHLGHFLVLAGQHSDVMLALWRKHGGGKVDIKGFVKSPSDLYNDCTVYCQPSATEAWGIEVIEAMAHGRPVICSEGAGAAEAIDDGVDGFVVPIRSPEAIADRLERLRKDPGMAADMGQKAREKAQRFAWDIIRKQYIEMWRVLRAPTV